MTSDNEWIVDKDFLSKTRLNLVSDVAITSAHIANGKTVPLVILDTTDNRDIEEVILFHGSVQQGHVKTRWGKSRDNKVICLIFTFINPVPKEFVVAFDTRKQGGVIDLIIKSQLLYIQPGKPKDRVSNTMDAPRLLVEVPSTYFANEWKKTFDEIMTRYFRKQGLSKKKAKSAATDLHNEWGIIRDFRLK
ncbi:hypothetical protein [Desulfosporosinus nitroreducens]|uniref:Uncharacterized protein n=1 Tax=Desulfosporosinus nitroreducens TaxID=2018668 RepID=A0ABT8QMH0_9FIRM|nr:hypothetical protein [Desulfosporosinus nitroreducens]MDO0822532.1 hypothetical protein [Desulfosporosinus nitroreducens]